MRNRLILIAAAGFLCIGWSPKTEIAVSRRGALLGPPDLARQIRKHSEAFSAGLSLPVQGEGTSALRPELAEHRAQEIADAIVRKIHDHFPFEEIVRDLGSLAHFAIVAGDPILSSRDSRVVTYSRDYNGYAEKLYERLPRVYYGIHPASLRGEGTSQVFRSARSRAQELAPFIGEEYYRTGVLRRSESFDDLAVTFGVASIALSHSASDIASLYTAIWRRANGDIRPLQVAASSDTWRVVNSFAARSANSGSIEKR